MNAPTELSARLIEASGESDLELLGFRPDDRLDVQQAVAAAVDDRDRLADIAHIVQRIQAGIGLIEGPGVDLADEPAASSEWRGAGVLPMLALLASADDVRAFHRSRGIPDSVSNRSLADLGQQVWVHRRTHGSFGLDTYQWMTVAWSGNLYWLGRLQFNLVQRPDGWAMSTHIPETGPLTPESVDDSFSQAAAFFDRHFPDHPAGRFHCGSWLLDPQLAEVLRPESNMVRFQKRWALEGEPSPGDADAIYFLFRKRGNVDLSALPRETSLQRAVLDKLEAGGHWYQWNGTIERGR